MNYDQEFIDGLGAIRKGKRPAAGRKSKETKVSRKPARRDEENEEDEEENERPERKTYAYEEVDAVSESVRLIRRFVNLTGKKIELHRLASFIRSLQRAIMGRTITKKDEHAKDINYVQELAINSYKSARGNYVTITLDPKAHEHLYAIGRGEKTRGSVLFLKRFVGMIGKPYNRELKTRIERILKSLAFMYKRDIIKRSDPYYVRVKEAEYALKGAMRRGDAVRVSPVALNGLHGIIEYETQGDDFFENGGAELNGGGSVDQQAYNDAQQPVPAALTGKQLDELKFGELPFEGVYRDLLGMPDRNFWLMIYGPPFNGKTTFALGFAKFLAEKIGRVAYVSPEQHGTKTQQFVARKLNALSVSRLEYFGSLSAAGDLREYDFIFIDSATAAGLDLWQVQRLRDMLPGRALITILQSTKGHDFRGEQGWRHTPSIVVRVEDGNASTEKNQYTLNTSTQAIPAETQPGTLSGTRSKTDPAEIEAEAMYEADLEWLADKVLKIGKDGVRVGSMLKGKDAEAVTRALRPFAEAEIEDNGAKVTMKKFRFSFVNNAAYKHGTAYFEAILRGSRDELRKLGADENGSFVFKFNTSLIGDSGKTKQADSIVEEPGDRMKIHEVKLIRTPLRDQPRIRLSSSEDIYQYAKTMLFDENEIEISERSIVVFLNKRNEVTGYYKHSIGGIDQTVIDIRLVLAAALKCLSSGIILLHNHPSGNLAPSISDVAITNRIVEAAKLHMIEVFDHLILSSNGYFSFADNGKL